MNTHPATEYRNLPLTKSVDEQNRDEVLATHAAYLCAFRANARYELGAVTKEEL
jgi:hypothetical protein